MFFLVAEKTDEKHANAPVFLQTAFATKPSAEDTALAYARKGIKIHVYYISPEHLTVHYIAVAHPAVSKPARLESFECGQQCPRPWTDGELSAR